MYINTYIYIYIVSCYVQSRDFHPLQKIEKYPVLKMKQRLLEAGMQNTGTPCL